ncbi:hypothetical protein [Siccirubricoccus sp. G192]|jgi:hypothetical protein|nr:hypothetical protein [Siccirubricoccus sp. G192]MBV1796757.1 hypothetical protein [Siccirubricoccus sp. G192]
MEEGQVTPEGAEEGVLLIEGWMLGQLLFPFAMEEIVRVPPANDSAARS